MDEASVGSVEVEIAVNSLRRALTQVLQSTDVGHQSKKLINASMSIIVEDFLAIPQERDQIAQLISVKNHVLFLCVFLWFIVLAIAFFLVRRESIALSLGHCQLKLGKKSIV